MISLSLFIAFFSYMDTQLVYFFNNAVPILMISPLGMYFSTRITLRGKERWLGHSVIVLAIFIAFLAFLFAKLRRELNKN